MNFSESLTLPSGSLSWCSQVRLLEFRGREFHCGRLRDKCSLCEVLSVVLSLLDYVQPERTDVWRTLHIART